MSSLVRPTIVYYQDADGRRVPKETPNAKKIKKKTKNWYGQYKDLQTGKFKRIPLYTDKEASRARLTKIVAAVARGEEDMIDAYAKTRSQNIQKAKQAWLDDLRQKGRDERYIYQQNRLVDKVFIGLPCFDPGTIDRGQIGCLSPGNDLLGSHQEHLPTGLPGPYQFPCCEGHAARQQAEEGHASRGKQGAKTESPATTAASSVSPCRTSTTAARSHDCASRRAKGELAAIRPARDEEAVGTGWPAQSLCI